MLILLCVLLSALQTASDAKTLIWERVASAEGQPRFFHSGAVVRVNDTEMYWTFGGLTTEETVSCDVDMLHVPTLRWSKLHRDCYLSANGDNIGPAFGRYAYTSVYSPNNNAVVIHGGSNVNAVNHRVGVLAHTHHYVFADKKADTGMHRKAPSDYRAYHPPPRSEHTAVMYTDQFKNDIMIVYGGRGNTRDWVLGSVLHYDAGLVQWSPGTNYRNVSGHSAVLHDGKMYVFGGWDGRGYFYDDLSAYDIETKTWAVVPTHGDKNTDEKPEKRRHASFVVVHPKPDEPSSSYALLFGGYSLSEDIDAQLQAVQMAAQASGHGGSYTSKGDVVSHFVGPEDEQGELQDVLPKKYAIGLWKLNFGNLRWEWIDSSTSDGTTAPQLYWSSIFSIVESTKTHHLYVYGGAIHDGHSEATGSLWRLSLHDCPAGYVGFNCTTKVSCDGIAKGGCNGHGLCEPGHCSCQPGYSLPNCKEFNCDYLRKCSGHGGCQGPNLCDCDDGWETDDCGLMHATHRPMPMPIATNASNAGAPTANPAPINMVWPTVTFVGVILLTVLLVCLCGRFLDRFYGDHSFGPTVGDARVYTKAVDD